MAQTRDGEWGLNSTDTNDPKLPKRRTLVPLRTFRPLERLCRGEATQQGIVKRVNLHLVLNE